MRTRERLIEVLRSVNGEAVGVWPFHAWLCSWAAEALERGDADLTTMDRRNMEMLTTHPHASPHIRSLAADALHYLEPRP